jgi:hypothetical protein
MKKPIAHAAALAIVAALSYFAGCSSEETGDTAGTGGRPELTGAECDVVGDCYKTLEAGALQGEPLCLDAIRGGYCTHTCADDGDCCAVPGECKTSIKQVCSPFSSQDDKMCFLSCEPEDLVAAPGQTGDVNDQEYCQREAGRDFICKSSGGGNENRKICVPGDCGVGAACAAAADCGAGLECITSIPGGYCGKKGCAANADCPTDSLCVKHPDGQAYCFKSCAASTDCTFCRGYKDLAACTDDVSFAEAGTIGTVCVPK